MVADTAKQDSDGIQVPEEVLLKSESSSWTIPPEASSATSRAQVRIHPREAATCDNLLPRTQLYILIWEGEANI